MSITLTAQDVRDAGDFNQSDYPDADIEFERRYAEGLVNDRLTPPDTDNQAYVDAAALLAAAMVDDGQTVSSLSGPSRSLSFDTDSALSLLDQAFARDPTNRLREIIDPDVSEPFVFNA